MKHEHVEPCRTHSSCVIICGEASWGGEKSLKYGWYDSRGRIARGGEVPLKAIGQMMEVAIREGGLKLGEVVAP